MKETSAKEWFLLSLVSALLAAVCFGGRTLIPPARPAIGADPLEIAAIYIGNELCLLTDWILACNGGMFVVYSLLSALAAMLSFWKKKAKAKDPTRETGA